MEQPTWHLKGNKAHLASDVIVASVDLLQPWLGLLDVQFQNQPLATTQLLQIFTRQPGPSGIEDLSDSYVRGPDLIATYSQTAERNVRPQIYWRALIDEIPQGCFAIELILSMQTSLLDGTPTVTTVSQLPAQQVWRMRDDSSGDFEAVKLSLNQPYIIDPQSGPGLLLFRLPGDKISYAEMVHPTDFVASTLSEKDAESGVMRLAQRLFPEHLEKGVIRRGRIRGVFLPRAGDLPAAADCYRQFITSAPPLTT